MWLCLLPAGYRIIREGCKDFFLFVLVHAYLILNNVSLYSFILFYFIIWQVNIADYGDNQWVTCFQESAEAILGQNAAYLGQLKDSVRVSLAQFCAKDAYCAFCLLVLLKNNYFITK